MNGLFKNVVIVVLIAAYALISHFALVLPGGKVMAAGLAVTIPACTLVWFIFQWLKKWLFQNTNTQNTTLNLFKVGAAIGVVLVVVLAPLSWVWPLVLANPDNLYFAQHIGTNALLAWVFGHTLMSGAIPLVVRFAKMVHKEMPAEIEAYARKVTVAWTIFFIVTCMVSFVLFISAPLFVWSAFAVLLQWPSVVAFFVGEYVLRKILFKNFEHASLKQGFEAYQKAQVRNSEYLGIKPSTESKS